MLLTDCLLGYQILKSKIKNLFIHVWFGVRNPTSREYFVSQQICWVLYILLGQWIIRRLWCIRHCHSLTLLYEIRILSSIVFIIQSSALLLFSFNMYFSFLTTIIIIVLRVISDNLFLLSNAWDKHSSQTVVEDKWLECPLVLNLFLPYVDSW